MLCIPCSDQNTIKRKNSKGDDHFIKKYEKLSIPERSKEHLKMKNDSENNKSSSKKVKIDI